MPGQPQPTLGQGQVEDGLPSRLARAVAHLPHPSGCPLLRQHPLLRRGPPETCGAAALGESSARPAGALRTLPQPLLSLHRSCPVTCFVAGALLTAVIRGGTVRTCLSTGRSGRALAVRLPESGRAGKHRRAQSTSLQTSDKSQAASFGREKGRDKSPGMALERQPSS